MPRVDRVRKSAKEVIAAFAEELLQRTGDPDARAKLIAIETIALRMSWNGLYDKLRWKSGLHVAQPAKEGIFTEAPAEKPEQWWQK